MEKSSKYLYFRLWCGMYVPGQLSICYSFVPLSIVTNNNCSFSPIMSMVSFHVLLLLFILTSTLISATTLALRMTKPDCDCGNISIPFPFGTTESCSYNSTFQLNCNKTSGQLFHRDLVSEIKKISMDEGQFTMMNYVARLCYDEYGNWTSQSTYLILPYIFSMSNIANKFTIIGCDSYGYISGQLWSRKTYSTGCIATCSGPDDLEEGSCRGMGCCQTSDIPKDMSWMNLTVGSLNDHIHVSKVSNCTFGFVIEKNGFRFSPDNLTNLMEVDELPALVDWVIAKETCELAQRNSSSYACMDPNSECFHPVDIGGYRFRCKAGYEGNPYLSDGCQDIDECNSIEIHRCTFKCINEPLGNFTCTCPEGYMGDGTGKSGCQCPNGYHSDGEPRDGGCIQNEMQSEPSIYKPISGAALGIIIVLLFSCLVHLVLKKRRSNKMKHMYFLQNGGELLHECYIANSSTSSNL